jgi:hypothetical protein
VGRIGPACLLDPTTDLAYVAARKAGIISVTPDGGGFWKVDLVGVMPQDKPDSNQPSEGCDYHGVVEPLATRSVAQVSRVQQLSDGTAEADLAWEWSLTSHGRQLVNALSHSELKDLDAYIRNPLAGEAGASFHLADVSASTAPHTTKRTLKRSPEGWRLAFDQPSSAEIVQQKLSSEPKVIYVKVGRVGAHCAEIIGGNDIELDLNPQQNIDTIVAVKAGYLTFVPDGKDFWDVTLTDKGKAAIRLDSRVALYGHQTLKGCDYQQADFIVARGALVKTTATKDDNNSPEIEYSWKWEPTELGRALTQTGEIYSKLNSKQREDLRRSLADSEMSPPMSVPVDSIIVNSRVVLKNRNGQWRW